MTTPHDAGRRLDVLELRYRPRCAGCGDSTVRQVLVDGSVTTESRPETCPLCRSVATFTRTIILEPDDGEVA